MPIILLASSRAVEPYGGKRCGSLLSGRTGLHSLPLRGWGHHTGRRLLRAAQVRQATAPAWCVMWGDTRRNILSVLGDYPGMLLKTAMMLLLLTLICAAVSPCRATEEPPMSVDVEAFQASKYVWRGLVCNDDPVAQPSLTLNWRSGVSFNLWGCFDETDFGDAKGKCSELDYTLSYDWTSGGKDWTIGYAVYSYPNTTFAGTSEILAGCAFRGLWGANMSLAWDVGEAKGLYLNLGWARTTRLGGRPVDISGGFGFADKQVSGYYYGAPSTGMSDASVCIAVPIASYGGWSIIPSITYTRVLRRPLREAVERPDNCVFGVRLARTF